MSGLGDLADRLYGLPPTKFVAARNAEARRLRTAGDPELAAAVRRLPRPSAAAGIVNQLRREHPDDVDELLALGDALRAAQTDTEAQQLRRLDHERRRLVAHLLELTGPTSDTVGEQVAATLRAAVADEGVADALHDGLMTRAVTATGWEPADVSDAVALPPRGGRPRRGPRGAAARARGTGTPRPARDADAERRAQREDRRHVREAERRAADAEREAHSARADAEAAETRHREARERLTDLRRQVHEAESELGRAQAEARRAAGSAAQAERAHERALRELRSARDRPRA